MANDKVLPHDDIREKKMNKSRRDCKKWTSDCKRNENAILTLALSLFSIFMSSFRSITLTRSLAKLINFLFDQNIIVEFISLRLGAIKIEWSVHIMWWKIDFNNYYFLTLSLNIASDYCCYFVAWSSYTAIFLAVMLAVGKTFFSSSTFFFEKLNEILRHNWKDKGERDAKSFSDSKLTYFSSSSL